jgi:hypothetical protein
MKEMIVIHETDRDDGESSVVLVASSRAIALELINEYYGKGEHTITNFIDIRDCDLDFTCTITVEGKFGGVYEIAAQYFTLDLI